MSSPLLAQDPAQLERQIRDLGEWFHNIDLGGVQTAPDHFLGDYPRCKYAGLRSRDPRRSHRQDRARYRLQRRLLLPRDEAAWRRARASEIDFDERYLAQARFAAEVSGAEIEFRQLSVYDVEQLGEKFDVVLFMGVLYHLRHPLLALDLIHEHVARGSLRLSVDAARQRRSGSGGIGLPFWQTDIFERDDFPRMYFIEKKYAGDPTNWWIPNRACTEAMLRSAAVSRSSPIRRGSLRLPPPGSPRSRPAPVLSPEAETSHTPFNLHDTHHD